MHYIRSMHDRDKNNYRSSWEKRTVETRICCNGVVQVFGFGEDDLIRDVFLCIQPWFNKGEAGAGAAAASGGGLSEEAIWCKTGRAGWRWRSWMLSKMVEGREHVTASTINNLRQIGGNCCALCLPEKWLVWANMLSTTMFWICLQLTPTISWQLMLLWLVDWCIGGASIDWIRCLKNLGLFNINSYVKNNSVYWRHKETYD